MGIISLPHENIMKIKSRNGYAAIRYFSDGYYITIWMDKSRESNCMVLLSA